MKVKFNAHGELFNYNGLSKNNENGTISFRFENVEDVNLLLSFLQDEEAMKTLTFYTDEKNPFFPFMRSIGAVGFLRPASICKAVVGKQQEI